MCRHGADDREPPPSQAVGKPPCSRWAVLGFEQTLKAFLTPLIQQKRKVQVSWGSRSTTAILPHTSSRGCHKNTVQKLSAVLCGKGLFLSAHKGCRRSFLAAPAPGELSQSSALLTDFRCPMWNGLGRAPRKGQKWGFASAARQGERGGEEISSLPPANSFSHGK